MNNLIPIKKPSPYFQTIICLVLISFIFTVSGCVSIENRNVYEDSKPVKKDYEIISVTLKNGQVIPMEGLNPKLVLDQNRIYSKIVYYTIDTTIVSGNTTTRSYKEQNVDFKDIDYVKVQIEKVNTGVVILVVLGPFILLGLAYLTLALLLSNQH